MCFKLKLFYKIIVHTDLMKRIKDPKSIGKLSTHKLNPFQLSVDKKISAVLPIQSKNKKNKLSLSVLIPDGKQDPLPYIKSGSRPLKMRRHSLKNPQNQICYVGGNKRKISRCIAIQMDSPRHSKAGKLYNPSLINFVTPGKIKHQPSQSRAKPKKEANESNINSFKNFLQHKYVQEVMKKKQGMSLIEYDHKFRDSVSSSTAQIGKFYQPSRYQQEKSILPVCSQVQTKPFYMSTSFVKLTQIYLKHNGDSFTTCFKEEMNSLQIKVQNGVEHTLLINNSNPTNEEMIYIYLQTSISKIKQILIEKQSQIFVHFEIPKALKEPLSNLATQAEIHRVANEIFNTMANFKPQLVSFKKFANCILLIAKSPFNPQELFGLLWYFDGSFYFGQWETSAQSEGRKTRKGIEYLSNQYLYFGQYKDNKPNGYGLMKKQSGQIYVGEWQNGQRSGWGKQFQESGMINLDGNYKEDTFLGSRIQSRVIS